jgi:hypothetical protein
MSRRALAMRSGRRINYRSMPSKLAELTRRELREADQKLTPEERLEAYFEHCQLLTELYDAGQKLRDAERLKDPPQ